MSLNRIAIALATIAGFCHSFALPQNPLRTTASEPQVFEVASIRPSGPKSVRDFGGGPGSKDPEMYRATSASLRDLIAAAWQVDYFQISSATALDRQNFDLVAKVPRGATKEQFRMMLQNFLAERFGLKMHTESRQFPAYELVVAKTGPKFKEVDSSARPSSQDRPEPVPRIEDGWPEMPANRPAMVTRNSIVGGFWLIRLKAQNEPLSQLASMLQTPNEPPVVDKTGLTAQYTFTLEYTKDLSGVGEATDAVPIAPDLSTALQQQLGLQLVSKKLPFDVVVVESFNKLPTEN
jgi:uncharacterized protein (TIGR03435 family)